MAVNDNKKPDYILLITAALIILCGFVIFASVSMAHIASHGEEISKLDLWRLLLRQFGTGLLPGLLIAYLFYRAPMETIKKYSPILIMITLVLLALILIPGLGLSIRGARRWLKIGPVSLQVSEFLKLTFILYLASWLSNRKTNKKEKLFSETFIAFMIVCSLISVLMYFQKDLSTLIVIILSGFVMYATYRTPLSHLITMAIGGVVAFSAFVADEPYRLERIKDFFGAGDLQNLSHQAYQALIAIGSGGWFGLGLGLGYQKYGFLPFPISDSIFAIYAEEAGFIGSIILILLFLVFTWRGIKIAKGNRDSFCSLIATGVSFWIFFQAFVHIGAMTGILPITGIPLPFISHGRAHLIAEVAALGILLNISKSS